MKIAVLAPFEEPVPPVKYGGTERVVFVLVEELIAMGHDVTLYASGDSQTSAKLVACTKKAVRTLRESHITSIRRSLNYEALIRAMTAISKQSYDIVHNNFGWEALWLQNMLPSPMITTLHYTDGNKYENYMSRRYKKSFFVSISKSQRQHHPSLNYIANVSNGIRVHRFAFNDKPKDYLVFLGRIHPQKGPDLAIEIARKTGHKLIMAAKIDPCDEEYFERTVKPLIDGRQIKFIGEVDHAQKVRLLKNAKALLSPLQWDEPFGIANIEAMACGTPVIAMKRGSMPELIINKKVGFLCRDINQMIRRVNDIDSINRQACRDHVLQHFTAKQMAEKYLRAYQKVLRQA